MDRVHGGSRAWSTGSLNPAHQSTDERLRLVEMKGYALFNLTCRLCDGRLGFTRGGSGGKWSGREAHPYVGFDRCGEAVTRSDDSGFLLGSMACSEDGVPVILW
jgi:hypothetical protein